MANPQDLVTSWAHSSADWTTSTGAAAGLGLGAVASMAKSDEGVLDAQDARKKATNRPEKSDATGGLEWGSMRGTIPAPLAQLPSNPWWCGQRS